VSRPGRRPALAKQVTAGAELVVLIDGPWAGRWYWADDLAAMQHAARRYQPNHPAGQLQSYQPNGIPWSQKG
jgi:hypothetical protein